MTPGEAELDPPVRRLGDWGAPRLRDLAAEHATPLYVVDLERVRQNARRLLGALDGVDVSYAAKANTARAVLEAVGGEGLGVECASAGEVRRALDAGVAGRDVRYTAVNPPARELDAVVGWAREADLVITAGAADTLERLHERGYDGRLALRVNPGVGAGHHAKVTTGSEPKFGVPYGRAVEVAAEAAEKFALEGLHAHAGSGFSGEDLGAFADLVDRVTALADDVDVEWVNVGGGFGVPYREDEPPLDLAAVAAVLDGAFDGRDERPGVEPGRYLVADAGVLLTTVNTVKETPETTVVGVDAGMNDLLRPALYGAYHAVRNLAPDADGRRSLAVEIAGPVCETADVLARDRPLAEPRRGDVIAIGNAGAYGYEMASQYNSRPRPAVVAVSGTREGLVRERESLDDLVRGERAVGW